MNAQHISLYIQCISIHDVWMYNTNICMYNTDLWMYNTDLCMHTTYIYECKTQIYEFITQISICLTQFLYVNTDLYMYDTYFYSYNTYLYMYNTDLYMYITYLWMYNTHLWMYRSVHVQHKSSLHIQMLEMHRQTCEISSYLKYASQDMKTYMHLSNTCKETPLWVTEDMLPWQQWPTSAAIVAVTYFPVLPSPVCTSSAIKRTLFLWQMSRTPRM